MKNYVTEHAEKRIRERMHMSVEKAMPLIRRAWKSGKKEKDLPCGMWKSYTEKEKTYDKDYSIRFYGDYKFVFSTDGVLLTVYSKPAVKGHVRRNKYQYAS